MNTAARFTFDPDRVAFAEANGWRAYYARDWFKMIGLLVQMNQAQFRIPFPASWLAAYYVVQASAAFAPKDHDLSRVRPYLEKFFGLARQHSGLRFDTGQAAEAELRYWIVHRELAGKPDKTEFVKAMIVLHSLIFGLAPERVRESAELRVLANNTVDLITSRTSKDVEGDWTKIGDYLRQCYRSIQRELDSTGQF